jgi:hypothetical protein
MNILLYRAYTKEWCVSKVDKNLFLTLHGHNILCQHRKLPKFRMCYQQFTSHAYCVPAVPVSNMASQDALFRGVQM